MPTETASDADAGVTPVMGVLLMVGVTLVVAGVLFVLVRGMTEEAQAKGPETAWDSDPSEHQVLVVKAAPGLDWADFELSGTCTPSLNGDPFPASPGIPVKAGDVLQCDAGEEIAIAGDAFHGNTLVFSTRFA